MKLVIVESPTKAKTIKKFLPKDYVVESSFGHIRDLPKSADEIPAAHKGKPWARLGVNVDDNFAPLYIVPKDKKAQVTKLKKLVKEADALYLASDEDREGEAISWHLLEVLQPKVPIYRMVFHEITPEAIQAALEHPRDIDMHLVEAQETRRILDRLYGYEISPILWRKVAPKLSAGRVQSAALELIVEREQARIQFKANAYWDITGEFQKTSQEKFEAKILSVAGKRVASGKDFDGTTGELTPEAKSQVTVLDETSTKTLLEKLANSTWKITSVQQKPVHSSPYAPFVTSTLQQEAGRKLGLPAGRTMRIAQRLYEQGLITYMRTDSVQLSQQAQQAAHAKIVKLYGANYLPSTARVYKSKDKTAQEAHEAIRPAGTAMRTVDELRQQFADQLDSDQYKLYELIWKRTVASQMADAKMQQTAVKLEYADVVFQANGRVIEFAGYLRVYVEGSDDPDADLSDRDRVLPPLKESETVTADHFDPKDHTTKPPARYTEAALIKELESRGIGRPSTYATIIDTIQNRGYVYKDGTALIPRFVAFAVVALLRNNFPNLVDDRYTAAMEQDLDAIAGGKKKYLPYLHNFYFGGDNPDTAETETNPGLKNMLNVEIDARKTCTIPVGTAPDGYPVNLRVGRYGPFVEHIMPNENPTASIPADLPPDQLTVAAALNFIELQAIGPKELGTDPTTEKKVFILEGRFGPYVQLGEKEIVEPAAPDPSKKPPKRPKKPKVIKPKMKGLLKGMTPDTITLEQALKLLAMPKIIGVYAKTGENIVADAGRFGPYIKCGVETRSLKADDNLLELTLERATELLDTPKTGRGRRGATALRIIGEHPKKHEQIAVYSGKFGPYLKMGKVNVTIPEDYKPEDITLEQAVELVNKKVR